MVETEEQIHRRMMSNVDDAHDKTPGAFIWDSTEAAAVEFSLEQKRISVVESKMDIENLKGDELTRFVYQRTGIQRKPATTATTTVVISGSEGASIEVGDLVGSDNVYFESLESKTIGESGLMHVLVESQIFGPTSNVPPNAINQFPITLSGLVDVYNPNAVTNGYDAETDEQLKKRYYDKLQRPGKAGNKYHYEEWAREVTGVGGVRVIPRWDGPLTVKVVIIDSNKQPASEELVSSVSEHIESEMPFGADLTVVSATEVPINITVTLSISGEYEESQVIETIKGNLNILLNSPAFESDFVSYARIGSEIIDSQGVLDYQNLLVNGSTANIPITNEQVAILGGVNE